MSMKIEIVEGVAGETVKVTASDTAASLAAGVIVNGARRARSVTIGVETNPIRIAFGGATPTSSLGLLMPINTFFTISGPDNVASFKYINANAGNDAELQVQTEF